MAEGGTRRRTVEWRDPTEAARRGRLMSGIEYLAAIRDGALPPPPVMALLGFGLATLEPGLVAMELEPGEHQYNPLGVVHGGVLATVLDSVMGCAVHSTLPQGRGYTTLEFKVNFVRAATLESGRLRAEGRLVHGGRQVATAEARIVDAANRLCAHATTTCLVFDLPPG
jgi:uncharacterized protein (TIGR00369 family)